MSYLEVLQQRSAEMNMPLDAAALDAFQQYYELIADYAARFNLTAVHDYEGVQRRHFAESLAAGAALRDAGFLHGAETVIDVGAGAGFPGIPLRIARPNLRLILLEANLKKVGFLRSVVSELGLDGVSVVSERAESAAHRADLRERFDLVISRAVASLDTLAELTLPFARVGGFVAAMKGSRLAAESDVAQVAVQTCGGAPPVRLPLPPSNGEHPNPLALAVIRKVQPTPASFPRRSGVPASRPIR